MIALLLSPMVRASAALAVIALLCGAIYLKGYSAAEKSCAARALAERLAHAEAELRSTRQAAAMAQTQSNDLEIGLARARKEIKAYAHALEKDRRRPVCRLDADDVRRLRAIR